MEPGWASFSLPYTLLAVAGEVDVYREEQHALDMARSYPVKEAVFGSMGFGQPDGTVPPRFIDGVCAKWWVPNLHVVADALGLVIEATAFRWETHPTSEELDTALGPVGAGTIGATFWELEGTTSSGARIFVDYVARVARAAPVPDHWPHPSPGLEDGGITYRIDGRPSFKVDVQSVHRPGDDYGAPLAMTALHAINAIPRGHGCRARSHHPARPAPVHRSRSDPLEPNTQQAVDHDPNSGPSVILLRRAPHHQTEQAALLRTAVQQPADDLLAGAIVVLTPGRTRIRRLPI